MVGPLSQLPAAGRQQGKAAIKGGLPRLDIQFLLNGGLNTLIAGDVAYHAVAVADHVTANRLAENLAVERRHAFHVAGRDPQHIGDSVIAPSGTQPRCF